MLDNNEQQNQNLPISPEGNPVSKIISDFEEKLKQNIFTKTLLAARDGQPLKLTDGETAYLTKQAVAKSIFSQMEIQTSSPIITLKKGKTELNIKNAATIVQKMEEKYPTPKPTPDAIPPFNKIAVLDVKEKLGGIMNEVEEEIERSNESIRETTKPSGSNFQINHFKKCVNFPASKVSPEIASKVALDENHFNLIQTVNRNAYEIREEILAMALDFVKWQTDMDFMLKKESGEFSGTDIPKSDSVLEVAKRFYSFVERR